jgi:UDP-N-acetyl-D-mannosaminuronate dehydrogenase
MPIPVNAFAAPYGILGPGEVGISIKGVYDTKNLATILKDKHDTFSFPKVSVLNVCIPYTENFVELVKQEIVHSKPELTIVHSTVPVGTTTKLDLSLNSEYNIVHSPIRGNHPNLTKSIQTFVKYIGSNNPAALKLAATHLRDLDILVHACNSFEKTEVAKLLCTTYYGLCIAWHNEIKKTCEPLGVDVSFIKDWNASYNKGYEALGLSKFNRPVLDPPQDNKIGGHCVIPNAELLDQIIDSKLIKEILTYK